MGSVVLRKLVPLQFQLGERYHEAEARVKAPAAGVSTFRAKTGGNKDRSKVLYHFTVSESLFGQQNCHCSSG